MPIYAYRCEHCGHHFEQRQGFNDEPISVCPNCHTEGEVHRVIQAARVIFKGSGFYVTDNRKSSGGGSASSTSKDAAGKETKNGSTEKPAAASSDTAAKGDKPAASSEKSVSAPSA